MPNAENVTDAASPQNQKRRRNQVWHARPAARVAPRLRESKALQRGGSCGVLYLMRKLGLAD